MLKTIILLIGIYFLVRYVRGMLTSGKRKQQSHFNPFGGAGRMRQPRQPGNRSKDIDRIEEAEFEDISDKEKNT